MVHDIAITERYLVFVPVLFDLDAAMGGRHSIAGLLIRSVGLVPRDDGPCLLMTSLGSRSTGYIFHPMNAYDEVDAEGNVRVVLDAVRHPKMFDRERRGTKRRSTSP